MLGTVANSTSILVRPTVFNAYQAVIDFCYLVVFRNYDNFIV